MNSLSVIIPVHNEERRIRPCIDRIQQYMEDNKFDYQIIIAEDGSTDRTVEIAEQYAKLNNKVILSSSKERLGKGGSILKAISNATKDTLIYIDVDLAADISEIERMYLYAESYDVIIGSRLIRKDLEKVDRPLSRTVFSKCYSFLCRVLFKSSIKDYQCGLKLLKKNPTLMLEVIPKIKTKKFAFDTELIVQSKAHGLRIKEVPVQWKHKDDSKINISKQIWCMGYDLLRIWLCLQIEKVRIQKMKFYINTLQMNLK